MAWNEPGNGKDPWNRPDGDAPDLDEIVRRMRDRAKRMFGGGSGGSIGGGDVGTILTVVVVILALWSLTGFYKVDDPERGVVLRFGDHVTTTQPGLHWHLPWPIEHVEKVNIFTIRDYPHKTSMLTRDENIVVLDMTVQYQATDPTKFLFNVQEPGGTLGDVAESAIREVVGKNDLDFVLGAGRQEIVVQVEELIQTTMDSYEAGVRVTEVNLQDAQFPEQVQSAVRDAIMAREDRERAILEAQSYENGILPRAQGAAARRINDAEAYREERIAEARGEASRFEQLLTEYREAPEVTRQRLYLETLERVYGGANKIVLDSDSGNNLIYLPLQEIMKGRAGGSESETGSSGGGGRTSGGSARGSSGEDEALFPPRPSNRDRGGR